MSEYPADNICIVDVPSQVTDSTPSFWRVSSVFNSSWSVIKATDQSNCACTRWFSSCSRAWSRGWSRGRSRCLSRCPFLPLKVNRYNYQSSVLLRLACYWCVYTDVSSTVPVHLIWIMCISVRELEAIPSLSRKLQVTRSSVRPNIWITIEFKPFHHTMGHTMLHQKCSCSCYSKIFFTTLPPSHSVLQYPGGPRSPGVPGTPGSPGAPSSPKE